MEVNDGDRMALKNKDFSKWQVTKILKYKNNI